MIGEPYIADHGFDFGSDYPGEPAYGHPLTQGQRDTPVWVIKDTDSLGHPLIRIEVIPDYSDSTLFEFCYNLVLERSGENRDPEMLNPLVRLEVDKYEDFYLYVKIVTPPREDPRLQVALDPELTSPCLRASGRRASTG